VVAQKSRELMRDLLDALSNRALQRTALARRR
jgi:hypothetical protein